MKKEKFAYYESAGINPKTQQNVSDMSNTIYKPITPLKTTPELLAAWQNPPDTALQISPFEDEINCIFARLECLRKLHQELFARVDCVSFPRDAESENTEGIAYSKCSMLYQLEKIEEILVDEIRELKIVCEKLAL